MHELSNVERSPMSSVQRCLRRCIIVEERVRPQIIGFQQGTSEIVVAIRSIRVFKASRLAVVVGRVLPDRVTRSLRRSRLLSRLLGAVGE